MDINANHVIKLARIAIRSLLGANKKGVVLAVASTGSYYPLYSAPLYCASKACVTQFVRCMEDADKLEGVKIVAICPGYDGLASVVQYSPGLQHKQ